MGWFSLVVLALASYRAARFVTRDSLTDGFRDRLYSWTWDDLAGEVVRGSPGDPDYVVPKARANWRTYVYELFTCQWCISVWLAAGAYITWRWWVNDFTRGFLYVLAVAAVAGFVGSRRDA